MYPCEMCPAALKFGPAAYSSHPDPDPHPYPTLTLLHPDPHPHPHPKPDPHLYRNPEPALSLTQHRSTSAAGKLDGENAGPAAPPPCHSERRPAPPRGDCLTSAWFDGVLSRQDSIMFNSPVLYTNALFYEAARCHSRMHTAVHGTPHEPSEALADRSG